MLKSPKTYTLADGSHLCQVIATGKRGKILSEVKPVKNLTKNMQSFLEISPVQKEVPPSSIKWIRLTHFFTPKILTHKIPMPNFYT